ncbi:MAG: glycosyltransferase [Armatimonadetes bacterium]|nr:glycosyltransferase [Armatimonadota bacterium]
MKSSKGILVISYFFPPLLGSQAIQAGRMLRFLPELGWQVHVLAGGIAPPYRSDTTLLEFLPGEVTVQRIKTINLDPFFFFLPFLRFLPDPQVGWLWPARKGASRIPFQPDVILSLSSPFTGHLAALSISRNLSLPWAAAFSDPWTNSPYVPNSPVSKVISSSWERKVLSQADLLIFPADSLRDFVLSGYPPEWNRKSVVIPHSFDPAETGAEERTPPPPPPWVITCAQNFYGPRTPIPLIHLMESFYRTRSPGASEIRVQLIGRLEEKYRVMIQEAFPGGEMAYLGEVEHGRAVELLRKSHAILLTDPPFSVSAPFFPAKIPECLAMARPIFGLTPPEGTAGNILRRHGACVVSPEDETKVGVFEKFLLQVQEGGAPVPHFPEELHSRAVGRLLSSTLETLL